MIAARHPSCQRINTARRLRREKRNLWILWKRQVVRRGRHVDSSTGGLLLEHTLCYSPERGKTVFCT